MEHIVAGACEEREGRVDSGIGGAAAGQGIEGTEDNTGEVGVIMWGRIILRRLWWWEVMGSLLWEKLWRL